MTWLYYAIGSAVFAGITAILAKVGIKKTDSDLATALRTIVVLLCACFMVKLVGSYEGIHSISRKSFIFLKERYSIPEGHAWRWIKVIAEPIEKYGVKMFLREVNGNYTLSIEESGGLVTSGKSKNECMEKLKNAVESMGGKDGFLKRIEDFNKMILERAGKNPLYEVA